MRVIAADTETFRFGEQPDGSILIFPPVICTSWAVREAAGVEGHIVSDGDGCEMRELWESWLRGQDLLVFHNASYDLNVAIGTWPDLEPLVWDKVERGQVTCTKIREKLLNLSGHGNLEYAPLPDGSKAALGYTLADLAMNYLGLDLSEFKEEDSIRTQYDLFSGMPSVEYPRDARHYAIQDAHVALMIYEAQTNRVQSLHGPHSLSSEHFQTACDMALSMATAQGMRVDPARVRELQVMLEETLSEWNLAPCIRSGIVRPAEPSRPHKRQIPKATDILEESEGEALEFDYTGEGEIDWANLPQRTRAYLEDEGIKFTKHKAASLNRKELCARVEAVSRAIGIEPKLTETGGICADAEVIGDIASFDEHLPLEPGDEELPDGSDEDEPCHPRRMSPLENYQYRQAVQKLVTTEIPRMLWGPEGEEKPADRVHFSFNVLVATGRTSSFASKHYPSGNGQQIDPRARPCYLPEEGCWLLSTDYSAMELCSVAQVTYELFGQSEHRNKINAGMDLHCNLGSSLASRLPSPFTGGYEEFLALKATDSKFFKHWRKFAKPVGLGYPGGLGANTFMSLSKKTYGVNIMEAAQTFPLEELPGPDNTTVKWHAAKLGIKPDAWEWTPFLRGIALSVLLKQIWLDTYPEMKEYFAWITSQEDGRNFEFNNDGRRESQLCYTSPMGMHRAGCNFTAAANGKAMQTPGAEGAKTAVYRLVQECRLGRLRGKASFHNFVHDEVLMSVPADPEAAAEAVEIVEEIMVDSMQNIMPDVKISVESALMERWQKEADPVRRRSDGLLVPWVVGAAYDKDEAGGLWLPE